MKNQNSQPMLKFPPTELPIVVPEKYTYEECAEFQRKKCNEGWTPVKRGVWMHPSFDPHLPICKISCRLALGARNTMTDLGWKKLRKNMDGCTEFGIETGLDEPPNDYYVDEEADYECFVAGGIGLQGYKGEEDPKWVEVGNTTVNYKTTWVLSWFHENNPVRSGEWSMRARAMWYPVQERIPRRASRRRQLYYYSTAGPEQT